MDQIPKELLADPSNHSLLILVVVINLLNAVSTHAIELVKAVLFSKRRKRDEEDRETFRCVLNDPQRDDQFKCKSDDKLCKLNEKLRDKIYDLTSKNRIR